VCATMPNPVRSFPPGFTLIPFLLHTISGMRTTGVARAPQGKGGSSVHLHLKPIGYKFRGSHDIQVQ
jgi:hypothetical protein